MTRRGVRRSKHVLDDLKEKSCSCTLNEALDRTGEIALEDAEDLS